MSNGLPPPPRYTFQRSWTQRIIRPDEYVKFRAVSLVWRNQILPFITSYVEGFSEGTGKQLTLVQGLKILMDTNVLQVHRESVQTQLREALKESRLLSLASSFKGSKDILLKEDNVDFFTQCIIHPDNNPELYWLVVNHQGSWRRFLAEFVNIIFSLNDMMDVDIYRRDELNQLSVKTLQGICMEMKADSKGNKKELVARILKAQEEEILGLKGE